MHWTKQQIAIQILPLFLSRTSIVKITFNFSFVISHLLSKFGLKLSKMKFEKTFGDTVRKLREENNLTLREVAEALEIDISMLGKIEKNNRKPTQRIIEKFSDFFKVNDKDLKIAFLSDTVANYVMEEEDIAKEVFKVAEEKVKYLKTNKTPEK